jgi:DNA modification methylase
MIDLRLGDCLEVLPTLEAGSVDCVITDPPYPEIDRDYGRMSEPEWHEMMRSVVKEVRRILKPRGSAVFVLQPNSERVGRMRPWLWDFMAWTAREWNQVQDVWWWNISSPPTVHCNRERGLMRGSLKACVWLGSPDCYRCQDEVLWSESEANAAQRGASRLLKYKPGGLSMRSGRCTAAAENRGGVTPFNVLPIANANSTSSAGAHGHGAGTPLSLVSWWIRYLTECGGTVLDPFMGSGTTGIACKRAECDFIGIESDPGYFAIAQKRIAAEQAKMSLFAGLEV